MDQGTNTSKNVMKKSARNTTAVSKKSRGFTNEEKSAMKARVREMRAGVENGETEVLARIAKTMPRDGVLYLGGAETVLGITDKFIPITGHRGMYGIAGGEPILKTA